MRKLSFIATAFLALAQDSPKPAESPKPAAEAKPTPGEPKPYDKVITKDAVTQKGLFAVHKVKDKHYFEIPATQLGKEMLVVVSFKTAGASLVYGGQEIGNRVVTWERRGNRVLLRNVSHEIRADAKDPISQAVRSSNEHSIIMSFTLEAEGKDGALVIDVGRLFTSEVTEFSARRRMGARGFDGSRSFIDRIRAFPQNINVEAMQTYTAPDAGPGGAPSAPGMRPGTNATIVATYSMIKLPENPMTPRLFDDRLGFFNIRHLDYSSPEHRAAERRFITRWRLEKKDPTAAVSEPVKPIVFYIDPATPEKWVPFVKKGVEDWQVAFEAAGFRKAILAADVPRDDPDFSLEDVRYSSIRWLPSTIQNAYGPHVHDPRTGEILEADIKMYHNILLLQRNWYFSQVGHLDKRAQKFPIPDDLMGELVRFVVAHEVGHSLGFPHNMKASGMYTVAQVRDKNWVAKNGHTPTIMDYSRFNYVAQPEDGIPVENLIPKIGPYDIYAAKWGYTPVPGAGTPEAEKVALHEWLKPQETTPWLRFSMPGAMGIDPTDQTEAVADSDPVLATTLGTRNLKRIIELMPAAFPANGDDYTDLGELYSVLLGQWRRELGHVVTVVGGMDAQNKHWGQNGPVYTPVPKARQKQAVQFLAENVLTTPAWAVKPEVMAKIEPQGAMNRILALQRGVLDGLLSPLKLQRMMENEALNGARAYSPAELLADLRAAVFSELNAAAPKVDAFRRNLQRAYLDEMNARLNRPASPPMVMGPMGARLVALNSTDDTRALLRSELKAIARMAKAKAAAGADAVTRAHLNDLEDQAGKILDPKLAPPASGSGRPTFDGGEWQSCWRDYRLTW
ncbi:MAG: zinc-dependent metalloprotease [Bryobacteraceae bacterium]|nr:zinc-dependent metalloprotease [Bryobacteraceae bacterium]